MRNCALGFDAVASSWNDVVALTIRMQYAAACFRQGEGGEEEYGVGGDREDRDRIGQRCRDGKPADQEWKQRADAAAEIVAKTLARAAQARRIELGEERTHAGEIPGSKEAERKAEQPEDLVGQRQLGIEQHDGDGAEREDQEQVPAADAVGEPRAY